MVRFSNKISQKFAENRFRLIPSSLKQRENKEKQEE
jgi:hypothetical protein